MKTLLILAFILLTSCTAGSSTGTDAGGKLIVSAEDMTVGYEASQFTVTVEADSDWGVYSSEKDWLTVFPGGGTSGSSEVTVSLAENISKRERTGELVFRTKSSKVSVKVTQTFNENSDIPVPEGYELVWQEEFDESEDGLPVSSKWWYETAGPGWVNNELQTYVAGRVGDITTADVSDGTLKIRAVKSGSKVYSARVNTNESWTYGWFEASLRLPKGKGTWPAFWMMPSVWAGWPEGGEIDIMEHVGCVPTEVSSSIHCKAYYHAIGTQKTAARKVAGVLDEFHTYALEWTPEYIKTYVDGKLLLSYNPDDYPKGRNAETWPFNKPFQLKLNLAWGGDWGGMMGVDESCLPAVYEIDYVRVFQKIQ